MITHAKGWAQARNLSRQNEIHGEWEYKIPTHSEFSNTNTRQRSMEVSAAGEMDGEAGSALLGAAVNLQTALGCL